MSFKLGMKAIVCISQDVKESFEYVGGFRQDLVNSLKSNIQELQRKCVLLAAVSDYLSLKFHIKPKLSLKCSLTDDSIVSSLPLVAFLQSGVMTTH